MGNQLYIKYAESLVPRKLWPWAHVDTPTFDIERSIMEMSCCCHAMAKHDVRLLGSIAGFCETDKERTPQSLFRFFGDEYTTHEEDDDEDWKDTFADLKFCPYCGASIVIEKIEEKK